MSKKRESKDESKTLADFSLRQIAEAFSDTLRDLTGNVYEVEVLGLDRRPKGELMANLFEIADVRLRIRQHHEDGDDVDVDDTQPRRTLGG